MTTQRLVGFGMVVALSIGASACSATIDTSDPATAAAGEGKSDLRSSLVKAVKLIDMSFSTEQPLGTEQAAALEAERFLTTVEATEISNCADTFRVDRKQVFGRFDGCRAWAEPAGDGWAPAIQCDAGYCSLQALDGAEIVRVDGSANLRTVSGKSVSPGSKAILVLDLGKLSATVSSEDFTHGFQRNHGVAAVVPHLELRTDGHGFSEAAGLPALPHAAGAQLGLGFAPAALMVVLPTSADRIELYFRFERWNYTLIAGEDGSSAARLDSRASDDFVSNSGKNFLLPVR